MSRLERLLNLTAALLNAERPLTPADIRRLVPGYPDDEGTKSAFRRAFERDKDTLRKMGMPIELVPIEGSEVAGVEGYVVPRDRYQLPDPQLEPDELAALHLAATAVRLEGVSGTEALWKLGGAVGAGAGGAMAALPGGDQLAPLFGAVAERRPVTFSYRGERRTVNPWRLSFQRGHWYLTGWDHARADQRQFRLDRIDGDVALGEEGAFERPADLEPGRLQPWEIGNEEAVTARLLVDADQAGWAVHHLGEDTVVARHPDGSVEVDLTVTNRDAFRSFVLGFLDHAEVLGPPELRDDVVAWLESLCRNG